MFELKRVNKGIVNYKLIGYVNLENDLVLVIERDFDEL